MRRLKLLCVIALLSAFVPALTPSASANMFKKHHHHHGPQHHKARPK